MARQDIEDLIQYGGENEGQVIKKSLPQQIPVPEARAIIIRKVGGEVVAEPINQPEVINIPPIVVRPASEVKTIGGESQTFPVIQIQPIIAPKLIGGESAIVEKFGERGGERIPQEVIVPVYTAGGGDGLAVESVTITIPKTLPQQHTNLQDYQVYLMDTDTNSQYFRISEFPDILTAGKSYFLIDGSEFLQPFTDIRFELLDSKGQVVYMELSDVLINGVSRMVSIYVYDGITNLGDATLTILGVLKDVPVKWKDVYNVKWQRIIKVNTLVGDDKPAVLATEPIVDFDEFYDAYNSRTISKIRYTYSITS